MTDRDQETTFPRQAPGSIPAKDTSADFQDGSASDSDLATGPDDLGSTYEGPGLTAGGTGTEVNPQPEVTDGGYAGDYGSKGDTSGGSSSGDLWSGTGIPPKPDGDYEV